jgi:20S proteasome alpha/beta subunit
MKPNVTLNEYLTGERPNTADTTDLYRAMQAINDNLYQIEENRRRSTESLAQLVSLIIVSLFFGLMSPILGFVVFFVTAAYQHYTQQKK